MSSFDDLRTAIWATTPAQGWEPNQSKDFLDLVQGCLKRWTDDIERTVGKAESALAGAKAAGVSKEGGDELERALSHTVAAREKLIAVLAQFLGVRSLEKFKGRIHFFPRENRVRHGLQLRAQSGVAEAGALLQALIKFDQLPAIAMRNQLTHGVTFFPEVSEICYFRVSTINLMNGEPDQGSISYLLPEGMLDKGDLLPETLSSWVEESATEALGAFADLVVLTTKLVEKIGELAPVDTVYRIPGQQGIFMEIPPPGTQRF